MKNSTVHIDTRTFIRFWLVVIGLGLAVYLAYNARTALIIIGVSLFLALALNAPVSRISKKLPGKSRIGATAIAYVAIVILLGAVIFLVIPPVVQQTAKFAQTLPTFVDSATKSWDGLRGFVDQYNLQPQVDSAVNSIKDSAAGWASNVGQSVISGIGSLFFFVISLFLVLVLTFLMLIEGPMWMERIWSLYQNKARMVTHRRIISRIYGVVQGYITGQLTVSTVAATLAGFTVFVLSLIFHELPANLAMPTVAITFILSLIPMFGSTIGAVFITALLAFSSIPAALVYIIYFVVYQQIENNFIAPHIQARKNELSALAVLVAITVGLYMFGLVGGIIAIPIAGTIRVLIDEHLMERNSKKVSKKELEKA
ncbi:MAG: AI-2E family transporter [Candidatus Saccharimonadales bacterium]